MQAWGYGVRVEGEWVMVAIEGLLQQMGELGLLGKLVSELNKHDDRGVVMVSVDSESWVPLCVYQCEAPWLEVGWDEWFGGVTKDGWGMHDVRRVRREVG